MRIRAATLSDRPAIRDVARRSLQASYSLEPDVITTAIDEWYGEAQAEESLADPTCQLFVGDRDDQVVGFSEVDVPETGREASLLWLHVDPAHRGEGVASALFDATMDELDDVECVYGRVLADNDDGNAFYRSRGFEHVGEDEVEIAGRTYVENLWADTTGPVLEPIDDDGRTVYLDRAETEPGSVSHFYLVYATEDASEAYGYYCGNCESLANAMDSMGRIECDTCGNVRKPTRWDAAYL